MKKKVVYQICAQDLVDALNANDPEAKIDALDGIERTIVDIHIRKPINRFVPYVWIQFGKHGSKSLLR